MCLKLSSSAAFTWRSRHCNWINQSFHHKWDLSRVLKAELHSQIKVLLAAEVDDSILVCECHPVQRLNVSVCKCLSSDLKFGCLLSGLGAVLWDGWRSRTGPVRGAPEGSLLQFWHQLLWLSELRGTLRTLSVSAPGWCHASSTQQAAAESGPPQCQGKIIHWLLLTLIQNLFGLLCHLWSVYFIFSFHFLLVNLISFSVLLLFCLLSCWGEHLFSLIIVQLCIYHPADLLNEYSQMYFILYVEINQTKDLKRIHIVISYSTIRCNTQCVLRYRHLSRGARGFLYNALFCFTMPSISWQHLRMLCQSSDHREFLLVYST